MKDTHGLVELDRRNVGSHNVGLPRAAACGFLFFLKLSLSITMVAQQDEPLLIKRTLRHEADRGNDATAYFYVSREKSTRTQGHLWTERVVKLKDGVLRRLVSVDGMPLTLEQQRKEDQRVASLVANPDAFRRANGDREDGKDWPDVILRAFVFRAEGKEGSCTRFHFAPDASFKPANYEERILHSLEGTVSIKEPEDRVCEVNARVSQVVEIGYGIVGKLAQGGEVHLVQAKTDAGIWHVTNLNVHLNGRILVVRNFSQNDDETRSEIRELPAGTTLAQAASLTKQ